MITNHKIFFRKTGYSKALKKSRAFLEFRPYSAFNFGGRNQRPKAENFPFWPKGRNSGIPLPLAKLLSLELVQDTVLTKTKSLTSLLCVEDTFEGKPFLIPVLINTKLIDYMPNRVCSLLKLFKCCHKE